MSYHFNFIYNRSEGNETEDSQLALNFVEYLDRKISGWGYDCYIPDRDCLAGRNIFDELFRIVSETEKTLVVITPGFRSNYWAKYSKQAAFKYLLDCEHQHKLIPIALNIDDNRKLWELNVNEPIHVKGLNEDEWESQTNERCFDKLEKTFAPSAQTRALEEIGDNRLRTEVQHQLVTRPASERSLSADATPRTEETYSLTQYSTEDQSYLSVSGHSSTVDSNVFPARTNDRSQIIQDGAQTETIPDQTGNLDQVDGSARQISSNLKIERNTSSINNAAVGDLSTRRGHISISEDTDLCTDASLNRSISTSIENTNEGLEARPVTLGACQEGSKLSLSSFEHDESAEVPTGSPDTDQTNPKYMQSESGYTTQSDNTPSPDRQDLLRNKTDDDKVISHYSSLHSDSKTVLTTPEPTATSSSGEERVAVSSGNSVKEQTQDSMTVSTTSGPIAASRSGEERDFPVSLGNVEKKQFQDSKSVSTTHEPIAASSSGEEKDAVSSGNVEKKQCQDYKTVSTTHEPIVASSSGEEKDAVSSGNVEKKRSQDTKSLLGAALSIFVYSIFNSDLAFK